MAEPTPYQHALKYPDVFTSLGRSQADANNGMASAAFLGQDVVRRPMRGIQVKRDTFATMTVLDALGNARMLRNSSAKEGTEPFGTDMFYANFLLTGSREERAEKFQAVTTFGTTYGFFFGEQPRFVTYTATLLNTADFQWEIEWWQNYDENFRGTALAENLARVYLYYDEKVVEGYIIRAATSRNAVTPHEVPMDFTMWVTNVETTVVPGATRMADSFDSGVAIHVSNVVSTTDAVRKANIDAYVKSKTGLLGAIRAGLGAIDLVTGTVNTAVDDVKNFLFGRTLVIPAGFAGSERIAGPFVVQDAATAAALRSVVGSSVTIRLPASVIPAPSKPRSAFWDNYDEYPARENGRDAWDAQSRVNWAHGQDPDAEAVQRAEALFAAAGFPVTNQEGSGNSTVAALIGRSVYGVASLVAQGTGFAGEGSIAADAAAHDAQVEAQGDLVAESLS